MRFWRTRHMPGTLQRLRPRSTSCTPFRYVYRILWRRAGMPCATPCWISTPTWQTKGAPLLTMTAGTQHNAAAVFTAGWLLEGAHTAVGNGTHATCTPL